MLNRAKEQQDLAQADRDIAEGEQRVDRQVKIVEELRRDRHNVTEAEKLLKSMRAALDEWREHRRQILLALDRKH